MEINQKPDKAKAFFLPLRGSSWQSFAAEHETLQQMISQKISSSLKQQVKVFFKDIESLSERGFGEI
jgi:hypothetical protein